MADTKYLRYDVETYVRARLALVHGANFHPQRLSLKGGGLHGFDAVSENGMIVMGVKTCALSNGKLKAGQVKNAISELWYLSLIEAATRTLVLTNRPFYDAFLKEMKGRLHSEIGVECIELPADMQMEVDKIIRDASQEDPRRSR